MIVHVTFTDGYFGYAELFLESFKHFNGNDLKVVFTTTDLTVGQIEKLENIYSNLVVHNKAFDYRPICKELGLSEKEVKRLKVEVEHQHAMRTKPLRTKWKMHVAAEKRVKIDIPFIMGEYESEDLIVHFDVDMYIRKPLDDLFDLMEKHDFTVMYRPHLDVEWRKVWICAMGIKINLQTSDFMKEWGKELDKIPLRDKPFGYGQTSCYRVYKELLDSSYIKFGNIPERYIVDGFSQNQNALIWSGNTPRLSKDNSLRLFRERFEESL